MNKFLINSDKFFNKLFIIALLVFLGFCLAGCTPSNHLQASREDTMPSNARYEYHNMQAFKQKNESFYKQLK